MRHTQKFRTEIKIHKKDSKNRTIRFPFGNLRARVRSPNTHVPVVVCRSAGIRTRGRLTAKRKPAAGGKPANPAHRGTRLEATTDWAFSFLPTVRVGAIEEAGLSCRVCGLGSSLSSRWPFLFWEARCFPAYLRPRRRCGLISASAKLLSSVICASLCLRNSDDDALEFAIASQTPPERDGRTAMQNTSSLQPLTFAAIFVLADCKGRRD